MNLEQLVEKLRSMVYMHFVMEKKRAELCTVAG